MSTKNIIFNKEAREAIKRGMDKVADAVRISAGPLGRNVLIGRTYGPPKYTNDGVTIAKEFPALADPFENMGAKIQKRLAERMNELVGDGTTTVVVLMKAHTTGGIRHISAGVDVWALRRGMERAGQDVVRELKRIAIPVGDNIENVATIAAESAELGVIIADTIRKVGNNSVVTVEESHLPGIHTDIVEGLEIKNGYISAAMITNLEKMEADYRDVPVLVTDKKISFNAEILQFLNKLTESGMKSLIIIGDLDGDALKTLLFNKLRGGFSVLAVRPTGYGDERKEMLEDIATTVGATLVSDDVGITLQSAELSVLGKASRVIGKKDSTVIVGGDGKKEVIEGRVAQLRERMEVAESRFDKDRLTERIGKLSGGVAVIRVGAVTEGEMSYLKDKIEDAVNATKAAIEEGIIAGGGAALVRIANKLKKDNVDSSTEGVGYNIVLDALYAPLEQICLNAGKQKRRWFQWSGEIERIIAWVVNGMQSGYNPVTNKFVVDMLVEGIVDPVKVTRTAVELSVSEAAIFITTEVAIVDEVKI